MTFCCSCSGEVLNLISDIKGRMFNFMNSDYFIYILHELPASAFMFYTTDISSTPAELTIIRQIIRSDSIFPAVTNVTAPEQKCVV